MKYITAKDIMEMFGVSRKTINNWMNKRDMPYIKTGYTLRFNESEVLDWFKKQSK